MKVQINPALSCDATLAVKAGEEPSRFSPGAVLELTKARIEELDAAAWSKDGVPVLLDSKGEPLSGAAPPPAPGSVGGDEGTQQAPGEGEPDK